MAKINEAQLLEYEKINKKIAELEARQAEIRDLCKERGSFETEDFKVTVSDIVQFRMASVDDCSMVLGMSEDRLKKLGALNVVKFLQVKVSRKKNK